MCWWRGTDGRAHAARVRVPVHRRAAQRRCAAFAEGRHQYARRHFADARQLAADAMANGAHRTFHPRRRVLRREPRHLGDRPVARAGVHRLSAFVARLHHQRHRRALPVRRGGDDDALGRHRLRHHRGVPDRAARMSAPYLKFAGPEIDDETIAGVAEVLASGQITSGPWVRTFEAQLAKSFGDRPVRVMTSATAAVEVALQLAGIGPGDEVITATQTFFTVMNMIVKVGARPVFVDCDLVTRNLDLTAVEAAITPRTRAIMPTYWPGSLPDMDALYALARRHSLRVIEDAALVQGSASNGRSVGAFGDLATFSFHPNKNMTSIEGGALVMNDDGEAARVEALRFHGIRHLPDRTRDVAVAGGKFNLPDVNARVGVAQLARLPQFLHKRRTLVESYFARFPADTGCVLPPAPMQGDGQSWNMFSVLLRLAYEVIFVNDGSRDRSAAFLTQQFEARPDVTRVVMFSSNYGQHMAIVAGFERARGERIVTLDADLQNPPEEIVRLLAAMDDGADYVGGVRTTREDAWWRQVASRMMNRLRERITHIRMTDQGCMLRAYSREITEAIVASPEVNTFIPALAYTFAHHPVEIPVAHEERAAGESKYSLYKLVRDGYLHR